MSRILSTGGRCTHPHGQTPPGRHPHGQTLPLGRHPPRQTPPGQTAPGRWLLQQNNASYWNAILLLAILTECQFSTMWVFTCSRATAKAEHDFPVCIVCIYVCVCVCVCVWTKISTPLSRTPIDTPQGHN